MDLQQLRYAVALAEESSFSRAAHRLGVAQPSLSQQIKKLEAQFGRPLFDRLPKRVVPTQAGQRLIDHARQILAQVSDVERQVCDQPGLASGTLTIGAIPTIAPFLLPGVLANLSKTCPAVEPRIIEDVTDRLVERVESGELDVAILSHHAGSRTLHVEAIAREALLLMLPATHKLAKKKSASWSALAGERFLVLHEMHCLSGQVTQVCARQRVRPPVVMRGAQLATIAAMVRAGLGVSIVPQMMRDRDSDQRDVYLPFADHPPARDICVAWSLLRYRTNASRRLVELLRQGGKPDRIQRARGAAR